MFKLSALPKRQGYSPCLVTEAKTSRALRMQTHRSLWQEPNAMEQAHYATFMSVRCGAEFGKGPAYLRLLLQNKNDQSDPEATTTTATTANTTQHL